MHAIANIQNPAFRKQVARSLFSQGVVLGELGRSEDALQIYKQMDERYGKDTDPGVREPIAMALFNQGVCAWGAGSF